MIDPLTAAAPSLSATASPLRVVVVELTVAGASAATMRRLRDAGHEVVYAGAVEAARSDLVPWLVAVCDQEDADVLVLGGEVPSGLEQRVDDELLVLLDEPGLDLLTHRPGPTDG